MAQKIFFSPHVETAYEITKWFQRRFRGECESPSLQRTSNCVHVGVGKVVHVGGRADDMQTSQILENVLSVGGKVNAETLGTGGKPNGDRDARSTQVQKFVFGKPSMWFNGK